MAAPNEQWRRLDARMLLVHPLVEFGRAIPALLAVVFAGHRSGHGSLWGLIGAGLVIAFGVLTVEDREQAQERVGGREGHKGEEAAATAIEMVSLLRNLPS